MLNLYVEQGSQNRKKEESDDFQTITGWLKMIEGAAIHAAIKEVD